MNGPRPSRVLYLSMESTIRKGYKELGYFVTRPEQVDLMPNVVDMLIHYKQLGYFIVGVSNQGIIALGRATDQDVANISARTAVLCKNLLDVIGYCPHHPDAPDVMKRQCFCRLPMYGLLIAAQFRLLDQYPNTYYPPQIALMVGSHEEDAACAAAAGIRFRTTKEWFAERTSHDKTVLVN